MRRIVQFRQSENMRQICLPQLSLYTPVEIKWRLNLGSSTRPVRKQFQHGYSISSEKIKPFLGTETSGIDCSTSHTAQKHTKEAIAFSLSAKNHKITYLCSTIRDKKQTVLS